MYTNFATDSIVADIFAGSMPFGIALGYEGEKQGIEVDFAFPTTEDNDLKIRDVMAILATATVYKSGSKEIRIRYAALLSQLNKRFEGTTHGKMLKYLEKLKEKQKKGAVGVIAIIMTPYDIRDEQSFSLAALNKLEQ